MDTVELLKEFAKEQGIDVKEVDKFFKKWDSPKTINELLALPENLLNHVSYISYLDEPLKSFITDEMWCERYMTIELERVVDTLYDRIYNLVNDDFDEDDIENLKIDDEEKQKELEELKVIVQYVIDTKFGSVVYDW